VVILWLAPLVILLGGMGWAVWRLHELAGLIDDVARARRSSAAVSAAVGGLETATDGVTAMLDAAARR